MSNVFKDYNESLNKNLPGEIGTIESETNPLASLSSETKPQWLKEFDYAMGLDVRPFQSNIPNVTFRSGDSSLTTGGANIDPSVMAARDRGLGMADSSLRGIQESRIGDPQDFMNKRLDPLRKGIEQQKTALTERQTKTGVGGSEFGRQTQENLQVTSQQKLEQGEAMAFNEIMSVMGSFDQSEGNVLKLQEYIKSAQFSQDAQASGMSRQLLASLTDIDLTDQGIREGKATTTRQNAGAAISLIGKFFGG